MDFGGRASLPPRSGSMTTTARPLAAASFNPLSARLVFRVHVVVLNLAERPVIEAVEDVREALVIVVERKTQMADASVANRGAGFFQKFEFQGRFRSSGFCPGRGADRNQCDRSGACAVARSKSGQNRLPFGSSTPGDFVAIFTWSRSPRNALPRTVSLLPS